MTPVKPHFPCLSPPAGTLPRKEEGKQVVGEDLDGIYRTYASGVSRWAHRLAGPSADLNDIVHDVFMVVQRRLPEFRGDAQLGTWLFEITVRVVQTHRRRKTRFWLLWGRDTQAYADGLSETTSSPLEDLERRESTALLYRFLDELDEKYRTAVILFELEGLSCQQIAVITDTSLANVWTRVSRGREKLLRAFANWTSGEKR